MNNRCFYRFYKTPAIIYNRLKNDSYTDSETLIRVKEIVCDFQTGSGDIKSCEYGVRDTQTAKMFFDTDNEISVNQYAVINGITYLITNIEHGDMGSMAILTRRNAI